MRACVRACVCVRVCVCVYLGSPYFPGDTTPPTYFPYFWATFSRRHDHLHIFHIFGPPFPGDTTTYIFSIFLGHLFQETRPPTYFPYFWATFSRRHDHLHIFHIFGPPFPGDTTTFYTGPVGDFTRFSVYVASRDFLTFRLRACGNGRLLLSANLPVHASIALRKYILSGVIAPC